VSEPHIQHRVSALFTVHVGQFTVAARCRVASRAAPVSSTSLSSVVVVSKLVEPSREIQIPAHPCIRRIAAACAVTAETSRALVVTARPVPRIVHDTEYDAMPCSSVQQHSTFVRVIGHRGQVLFSQNKSASSTFLSEQISISHQPNEQADEEKNLSTSSVPSASFRKKKLCGF
jgi:hypothetical protein